MIYSGFRKQKTKMNTDEYIEQLYWYVYDEYMSSTIYDGSHPAEWTSQERFEFDLNMIKTMKKFFSQKRVFIIDASEMKNIPEATS